VTAFSADWLALREPYDLRARNPPVLVALAAAVAGRATLAIVDLACGAGATLRAIAPHLAPAQSWRVVDNDPGLLARAASSESIGVKNVAAVPVDIARELEAALADPVDLVTTSALLDLVSADWLALLANRITGRGLLIYAALTYDGSVTLEPADPFDAAIVAAVNQHQRGDKGFGPALGPAATTAAIARFEALGYAVVHGQSDWALGPRDVDIQEALLTGWAEAAGETGDLDFSDIEAWLVRRRAHLAAGRSSISVGHSDFFARPTGVL
jgi:hypothetical protein